MDILKLKNKIYDVINLLRIYWNGFKSNLDRGEISELKIVKQKI